MKSTFRIIRKRAGSRQVLGRRGEENGNGRKIAGQTSSSNNLKEKPIWGEGEGGKGEVGGEESAV